MPDSKPHIIYGCQNCVIESIPPMQSVDIFHTISCFHSKYFGLLDNIIGRIPPEKLPEVKVS